VEEKVQFEYLYHQYLNNQCTAEELKLFFRLLEKSKDDEQVMTLMSATWDQTAISPEKGLTPPFPDKKTTHRLISSRNSFGMQRLAGIAATLLIVIGICFYWSDVSRIFNPPQESKSITTSTERKQFDLSDGTKVWLSPNSKLSYSDRFEGTERKVSLEGEAFFEVAHDVKHPFIIKSGQINTTVLGTAFNVTAYKEQHIINVTLVTGRVTVSLNGSNSSKRDTILANQRIVFDKISSRISKVDYPDAATFMNKRLGLYEYKGAEIQEVSRDLENQYNIKIKLDKQLSEAIFYGNLNMSAPLDETLNKLSTVVEAKWRKEGGHYVILK